MRRAVRTGDGSADRGGRGAEAEEDMALGPDPEEPGLGRACLQEVRWVAILHVQSNPLMVSLFC